MTDTVRLDSTIVSEMARVLREKCVPLDDQGRVIAALSAAHFLSGDILGCMDRAIAEAREGANA